jgi:hypothetical protein
LYFAPSHSWNSFNRYHFPIYMHVYTECIQYSPSHALSPSHSSPTGTNPPGRTCFALLFSDFVREKKWHFCLFKIATQGVSLWHFHVYMHCTLI